jgi:autophagy-related protein 2
MKVPVFFFPVLSRVKVKFADTVIRLEHVPKDSNSGVAVEFRIKK